MMDAVGAGLIVFGLTGEIVVMLALFLPRALRPYREAARRRHQGNEKG
jgi:hypothetical protein